MTEEAKSLNETSGSEALAAPCYVVSIVLVKHIPNGMNIKNILLFVDNAINRNEARGMATEQAMEEFPEHQVHTIIVSDDLFIRQTT